MKGFRVNAGNKKVMWYEMSEGQRVRSRILENIHVLFAGKEFISIQSCV